MRLIANLGRLQIAHDEHNLLQEFFVRVMVWQLFTRQTVISRLFVCVCVDEIIEVVKVVKVVEEVGLRRALLLHDLYA